MTPGQPIAAAQYLRMSTDHQRYSIANQAALIERYAASAGFRIVRTFADAGRSGISIKGRSALQELLAAVVTGAADFSAVLVYDVSRWGRFQDADESAHYEFLCRRAGIEVRYCAEQFDNDGSLGAAIIKSVKRVMAGEYSRELSAKVFAGQARLTSLGYRQGGLAGFGLRRALIGEDGALRAVLRDGQQKHLQTDRVILVPGPPEEVAVVRDIFRLFVRKRLTERQIATLLNGRDIRNAYGRPWDRQAIWRILVCEKYIGHNVRNKQSTKLGRPCVYNPPEEWIRRDHVFAAIVPPSLFRAAQRRIAERTCRLSEDAMLRKLAALARRCGTLSERLIQTAPGMPSGKTYRDRFGSLMRAYALIGYRPRRRYASRVSRPGHGLAEASAKPDTGEEISVTGPHTALGGSGQPKNSVVTCQDGDPEVDGRR